MFKINWEGMIIRLTTDQATPHRLELQVLLTLFQIQLQNFLITLQPDETTMINHSHINSV
jgi:hypothetical protein